MKKYFFVVSLLMLVGIALSREQSNRDSGVVLSPQLEKQIRDAERLGQEPTPAWIEGYNELQAQSPSALEPQTIAAQPDEFGFDFSSVKSIHLHELSPLEQRIRNFELQMQNFGKPTPLDDETFQRIKLELAELYAQLPRERSSLDDGADACPAVTLPANIVPYTDYGTTLGAVNNFNPIIPCGTTFAPDKIYRYVPTYTGYYVFDTFGSDYDTQLYVNTGGTCPGNTQLACNDDYFSSQSRCQVLMNAGQEYFIIVDGFNGYSGNYILHVTGNCAIGNGSSWQQECAESAGDPSHAMLDCNGGCNNGYYGGFPQWQPMNHCQLMRGNSFTYQDPNNVSVRDIDCYYFTLTEPCSVSVNLLTTFSYNLLITDYGFCLPTAFYSLVNMPACNGIQAVTPCLPAGTYSLEIMPNFFSGMTTPQPYVCSLDLIPCSGCRVDGSFVAPSSFIASGCGGGSNNSLRPSPEATYCVVIPYASDWTFSVCGSSPWNSYIYLTSQCDGGIIAQDNDGCTEDGLSKIECLSLSPGNYYLTIEGFNPTDCDQFYMTVTECVGSCCYGDYWNPSCLYGPRSACDALGGAFTLGQQCTPGLCYIRPSCADNSLFSQQPHVPDETWSAFASDDWTPNRIYENYAVSGGISTVRFWGLNIDYNSGLACAEQPGSFRLSFIDSASGPAIQTYNVTALGSLLQQNYGANYPMYEYTVQLPTPCTFLAGRVSIVGNDSNSCVFHWTTSPQGNGSVVLINGGGPVLLPRDMAVCLERGCPAPDSVVIKWSGTNSYDIYFRLYESSYVRVYYSTDVNAVFPATYSVLTSGSLAPGSWFTTDLSNDPQRRYVLTAQCGPPPIFLSEPAGRFHRVE